jgi:hypothetical protein
MNLKKERGRREKGGKEGKAQATSYGKCRLRNGGIVVALLGEWQVGVGNKAG